MSRSWGKIEVIALFFLSYPFFIDLLISTAYFPYQPMYAKQMLIPTYVTF